MRKLVFTILILSAFVIPTYASGFNTDDIPESAEIYLQEDPSSFWKDLQRVVMSALMDLRPDLAEITMVCAKMIGITLLGAILSQFSLSTRFVSRLAVVISIGILMFNSGHSLIELGEDTVREISEYGKILLPVLTSSLAAQGAVSTSTVLYTGTALFTSLLNAAVSRLLIPLLYLYLCICIGNSLLADETLKRIRAFLKWLLTWTLKIILYMFTGYMSISGVISGTVDASTLKATKLVISGAVPVVGNILSDASETILLSTGMIKNSVGSYGIVVLMTLLIGPFLKIGLHYVLMKLTTAVCAVFAGDEITKLIEDYSSAMGYVLAMTGVSCVLLLIGIVCMMKGAG